MVPKLSSRQQAQVAFLERVAPKLPRIYSLVEQLGAPRVDETVLRALGRQLEDIKGNAAGLSLGPLAETASRMVMLIRSGGAMAVKVRGLRELHSSLKMNYDAALRAANTPEEETAAE
jgi:chemotaxis protein histidine kinase CheA